MSYITEEKEALAVLAYLELPQDDAKWIDNFRKEHDPLFYGVIEPHFTLVFPTFGFQYKIFEQEIREKAISLAPFEFVIRCAMMNNDQISEYYFLFLVPDEGHSNVVKLRQKLNSGMLNKTLSLDIDFIPHIGIGSYLDKEKCIHMVNTVNDMNIMIKGVVKSLTIISYSNLKVSEKTSIELIG